MAKKITRATLNELAKEMALLSEQEQQAYLGGGSGTEIDPYTYDEYLQMSASGNWSGGYVDLGEHWDSHMPDSGTINGNKLKGIGYVSSAYGDKYSYDAFEKMVAVGEWKGGLVIHRDGSTKYLPANAKDPDGIINQTGTYILDQLFTLGYIEGYEAGKSPGIRDDFEAGIRHLLDALASGTDFANKPEPNQIALQRLLGRARGYLDGRKQR